VAQQALQRGVGQHALVAVLRGGQHMLQLGVVGLDVREGLVQRFADVLGACDQAGPAGIGREDAPLGLHLHGGFLLAELFVLLQLTDALLEHVVEALEEQQAEDVVLEVRRVDGAAQDVGGLPEPGFEGVEGELLCHVVLFVCLSEAAAYCASTGQRWRVRSAISP
jgi:hypothetical protein